MSDVRFAIRPTLHSVIRRPSEMVIALYISIILDVINLMVDLLVILVKFD